MVYIFDLIAYANESRAHGVSLAVAVAAAATTTEKWQEDCEIAKRNEKWFRLMLFERGSDFIWLAVLLAASHYVILTLAVHRLCC